MPDEVPLTTLLSWVWIAHTIEVDNTFESVTSEQVGRHFRVSLPMWTNGLRFIDDEGVIVDELRSRARAKSTSAGSNVGGGSRSVTRVERDGTATALAAAWKVTQFCAQHAPVPMRVGSGHAHEWHRGAVAKTVRSRCDRHLARHTARRRDADAMVPRLKSPRPTACSLTSSMVMAMPPTTLSVR